ncbi:metal-dependent hydrolase [Halobacteriovorax sp. GB3]|uniref:metal-dependent hydrolase n=1 Tax=Halobacteriovorax sp. GB3 TaxID=2719615 RepID=UPI0023612362|nr:metal-dependent hydrolase [Halobacteriovorax sp. GB3]MDD0853410.1 metal-dependent hydrolase [Halobacteriovorax sp. GB3]
MDPVTQAVLGASVGQSYFKKHIVWASFFGALAGMAPDLDYIIRSKTDPLFTLEYHRQITHSLAFIPFGALIVAVLLHFIFKKKSKLSFKSTYLFCFLGYATHGLLDACTNYGTHLLWPFSNAREAWNIVAVIDPLATMPFLILCLLGLKLRKRRYSAIGLSFFIIYIGFGKIQQMRAKNYIEKIAKSRSHTISKMIVKPTAFNNILWRSVYKSGEEFFVDALRVSWSGDITFYAGESVKALDIESKKEIVSNKQFHDLKRFNFFSDEFLFEWKEGEIGDLRYSLVPNEIKPIWSIRFNLQDPLSHVDYWTVRELDQDRKTKVMNMIKGKNLN